MHDDYLPFTRPSLDEETIVGVVETLRSGWLASGPQVLAFERALSAYLGGRSVRAFSSATGALEVALRVCGVGPGDEVIVPALSFVATANVVLRVGATPVFVDVDPCTRNLDLERSEAAISPRTRAIMAVHFAGLPVDLDALHGLARRRGLRVIEDAAHAIGSAWRGGKVGSVGDIVAFSFHPNKNMTTIEGGALVLDDPEELQRAEQHRFHGIVRRGQGEMDVALAGGKFNLNDVAARVGLGQLQRLDECNAWRRELAAHYFTCLGDDPVLVPPARGDEGHSWNMFTALLPLARLTISRREFIAAMHARGVGVGVHYPALHLLSIFRGLGHAVGDFPHAEQIGRETITLPLFPAMTRADVERVCRSAADIIAAATR